MGCKHQTVNIVPEKWSLEDYFPFRNRVVCRSVLVLVGVRFYTAGLLDLKMRLATSRLMYSTINTTTTPTTTTIFNIITTITTIVIINNDQSTPGYSDILDTFTFRNEEDMEHTYLDVHRIRATILSNIIHSRISLQGSQRTTPGPRAGTNR